MGRIKGERVNINANNVSAFFSNRVKKDLPYRYNYTNYQDANPDLVILRDKKEKEKIVPLLEVMDGYSVLDIGCGVGRWGDFFADKKNCNYVGIDYCEEILEIARKHFAGKNNISFQHASFQNVREVLIKANSPALYDIVIINGVMMYINDDDIPCCLRAVKELIRPGGKVYVKESVGKETRLTLSDIYSDELTSNYSAIYRSIYEYNKLWEKYWSDFVIYQHGDLWDENVQNRSETATYYWLFNKN